MRTVIETPTFEKQADAIWSEDERLAFVTWIALHPTAGDVIPGADGARKVRWSGDGKGKRGGVRVIYFNLTAEGVIYLITLYKKSERDTIGASDIKEGYAMNIDAIAAAIEQDAGESLPGLRDSLAEMQAGLSGRTYTPEQLLVKAARERLGLSQHAFAELIDTPVATLRDWEQGRFAPPGAARRLLEIALRHPEVLTERAA